MSDDLLNPGHFDAAAQQLPAWVAWSRPERIAAQVDRLFTETLPMVSVDGEPRPDGERFTHDMVGWVCNEFDDFFPDVDALYAAYEGERQQRADQFVCYFGEALRLLAGGEWFNERYQDAPGSVLYGEAFTPAIGYRWGNSPDDLTDMLFEAAEADGSTEAFMMIGTEIYSRSADYAEKHGLPHPHDETRRKHGLV
ncbi:hypothetical protein ACFXHA_45300 [Nocardia sp. NPDC059240]|uniref:hypothetical protein n=1 Tax=Nocardia sp. NPDC059240 TaxID=3346786 RepID=UPI0036A25A01